MIHKCYKDILMHGIYMLIVYLMDGRLTRCAWLLSYLAHIYSTAACYVAAVSVME